MRVLRQRQYGVTLLEILLVLALAALILILSVNQYFIYRKDLDRQRLQYNVDAYFQAMANYFRANCDDPYSDLAKTIQNPLYGLYANQYLPIDIATLKSNGYLTQQLPLNPLADNKDASGGYIAQFNQMQVSGALPQRIGQLSDGNTRQIGQVVSWTVQVAVKLKDPSLAGQYKQQLGADCVSSSSTIGTNTYVLPCNLAPTDAKDYLVWQRFPSGASPDAKSVLWYSMPNVKQFTQMYDTFPILFLTSTTANGQVQIYRCGT